VSAATRHTRSILATRVRDYGADSVEAATARREHRVVTLEDHIADVVNSAPPLTPEHIERLRRLLPAVTVAGGEK
jgi:hypothetical protein